MPAINNSLPQEGALIITSSGGAGHINVANNRLKVEQNAFRAKHGALKVRENGVERNVDAVVLKNVMKDMVNERIGNMAVNQWNDAQKKGDIALQEKLIKQQPIAEKLFFIPIFVRTLISLFCMDVPPKKVINTQVMGCAAILMAIKVFNKVKRSRQPEGAPAWQDVKMELWMTDFVSKKAVHFLEPLKHLTKEDKELLTVKIPNDDEDDYEYFLKNTTNPVDGSYFQREQVEALPPDQLPVEGLYTDIALGNFAPDTKEAVTFDFNWDASKEKRDYYWDEAHQKFELFDPAQPHSAAMDALPKVKMTYGEYQAATIKKLPKLAPFFNEAGTQYTVPPGDIVYNEMLGSQPTEDLVKEFFDKAVILAKHAPAGKVIHCFAFCGKDGHGMGNTLFQQMQEIMRKEGRNIPDNLRFVPLPFQSMQNIARIMARSKRRFTRGGGATCFEHLAMAQTLKKTGHLDIGKVCVVAEVRLKDPKHARKAEIFDEIPVWEGQNAKYLHRKIDAQVVSRDTIFEEMVRGLVDEADESERLLAQVMASLSPDEKKIVDEGLSHQVAQRIHEEVKPYSILNTLGELLAYPSRYFGSKTFSVLGAAFHAIQYVFKKALDLDVRSFSEELFGKDKYDYAAQPITLAEAAHFTSGATIAAATVTRRDDTLANIGNLGYVFVNPDNFDLNGLPGNLRVEGNRIIDTQTGLHVIVVRKNNDVVISMGGENAAVEKQIGRNNWFGAKPAVYEQAEKLIQRLQAHNDLAGKQMTLVGHGMGGSIASYVGIKNKITVESFNTVPLGVGLQQAIGEEKLGDAKHYVTHISVKNDLMSDTFGLSFFDRIVNLIGIRTPGNFGRHYSVPTEGNRLFAV